MLVLLTFSVSVVIARDRSARLHRKRRFGGPVLKRGRAPRLNVCAENTATVIAEIFVCRVKLSYSCGSRLSIVRYKFSHYKGGVTYTGKRVWFSYATKFRTFSQKYEKL